MVHFASDLEKLVDFVAFFGCYDSTEILALFVADLLLLLADFSLTVCWITGPTEEFDCPSKLTYITKKIFHFNLLTHRSPTIFLPCMN